MLSLKLPARDARQAIAKKRSYSYSLAYIATAADSRRHVNLVSD